MPEDDGQMIGNDCALGKFSQDPPATPEPDTAKELSRKTTLRTHALQLLITDVC